MRIPTHIVIDTHDGFTWAKDINGNPFTEATATKFCDERNDEMKPEHRTYILAAVVPVMSRELIAAAVRERQETLPQLEQWEANMEDGE